MGYSDENFDKNAPWRDRERTVSVRVVQTLVCDYDVQVPDNLSDEDVKKMATELRLTPAEAIRLVGADDWEVEKEEVEIL